MSNQQLSINAFKEFRKGNFFIAWHLDQKSGSLNEGVSFGQWFAYNNKRLDGFLKEEKKKEERYLKFNN